MIFKCKNAASEGQIKQMQREYKDYDLVILNYAIDWARAMEDCIMKGIPIADCAKRLRPTDRGMSGGTHQWAVELLIRHWAYWEEFRLWHNADCGLPESTGVVDCCIIQVGKD